VFLMLVGSSTCLYCQWVSVLQSHLVQDASGMEVDLLVYGGWEHVSGLRWVAFSPCAEVGV
jgi:hypothetical protein